ncbi:hypothetical protein AAEX28_04850 [Lentisphaerota bacterium WC36G]|nr:hypothetical protein LJT99_07230 [Lentisphaerae bacterium WC36]UDQ99417.1 hypothetical protein LJT99_07710 [Lentisphaerae bacterium WC36]
MTCKEKRFSCRISSDLHQRVIVQAERFGISHGGIYRRAVRRGFRKNINVDTKKDSESDDNLTIKIKANLKGAEITSEQFRAFLEDYLNHLESIKDRQRLPFQTVASDEKYTPEYIAAKQNEGAQQILKEYANV